MKKFVVLLFVVLGMFISYDADARKIEALFADRCEIFGQFTV